jgi:hypothetical protein
VKLLVLFYRYIFGSSKVLLLRGSICTDTFVFQILFRERGARALEERLNAAKVEDPVTNVEKKAGPIGSEDNV